ncbi:MAG TPA: TonB family protein [Burkholderiales bacterium]
MMSRRLLFQLHWLLGITAGLVLALVGATGAMLSFEDELLRALNPGVMVVPERSGERRPAPLELLARLRAAHPERELRSLAVYEDARHAARVVLAPREVRYVDPYSAELLGAPRGSAFFRAVREVHRRLAAGELGKQVVGACTVALLLLCLSGLYLRWQARPRDWRAWLLFSRARGGRTFLSQLHAVFGTWVLLAYLVMGLTGLYWSYDGYRAALFAMTGAARAERAAPGETMVSYLRADAAHERAYDRMVVDARGETVRLERYADKDAGGKLMASIFALHSGAFFGLPGTVAFMLASLLMPVFAVTGWMMYLRRRRKPALLAPMLVKPRAIGMAAALGLHAFALYALLEHKPARSALFAAAPIRVELVVPPKAEPAPAPPPKPKPKPVVKRKPVAKPKPPPKPEPKPVLAAPAEAPAPLAPAPPPPPAPEPSPPPPPAAAPVVAAAPPAPPPEPVVAPVFSADYLKNPPPDYPALSRRLGEQGRVLLRVHVDARGRADEVQVRASSGFARLDEAAQRTVRGWKFVPARRGDDPVAAWVLIPISFRLEG